MNKLISIQEAVAKIDDGMSVMVGGFMGCGNPHGLIDGLIAKGVKDLTIICNDASFPDYGIGKMIVNKQVKKLIATHVGLNPEVSVQMNSNELEVVLIPQGSLAEMIRAGGAGLGGVLTPTGIGTVIEYSTHVVSKVEVDGKPYLLERPLRADVAIIAGHLIDETGNIWYKGTTRNFNQVMATAADLVIAEAEQMVAIGAIEPENVVTPGIFVDYIVYGGKSHG